MAAVTGEKKAAQELFGVCGNAPIPLFTQGEHTPKLMDHNFSESMIILGIAWMFTDTGKNLFLSGPTGAGKSTFVEQFCARIGMPVYVVACHGKLEFNELLGSWCMINENGNLIKKWVDGPMARAMKEGVVLLLDEANFLDPAVTGGLNRVLDGMSYYVPETNETIHPHEHFRVVMTSNPFDPKYKGVKKMNIALLDRFLAETVDYMSPLEEAKVINKTVDGMSSWIIEFIISVANTVRTQFKAGEMETTISTRGLIRWARMIKMSNRSLIDATSKKDTQRTCEILTRALGHAVTNRSDPAEKAAIDSIVEKSFKF